MVSTIFCFFFKNKVHMIQDTWDWPSFHSLFSRYLENLCTKHPFWKSWSLSSAHCCMSKGRPLRRCSYALQCSPGKKLRWKTMLGLSGSLDIYERMQLLIVRQKHLTIFVARSYHPQLHIYLSGKVLQESPVFLWSLPVICFP